MVKVNTVKVNLLLQTLFQVIETLLPLITAPYISRVLGSENLGIFSYTSSITSYFILLAMLGTYQYGIRAISEVVDNQELRNRVFSEIFVLQSLLVAVSSVLYAVYLFLFCENYFLVTLVQYWLILACLLDVNWLFAGLELFKITVGLNLFIRLSTVVSIFLFVKNSSDLWVYTLIMSLSTFISRAVLWSHLFKYVQFQKVKFKNVIRHMKGNLLLFYPLLAMSIYHAMDKTMLGYLSSFEQSGYYYNADKIINIPVGVLSGISVVVMPYMTKLTKQNLIDEVKRVFYHTLEGIVIVSSAMAFGIAAIAYEFEPLFFGEGYSDCILLTIVLSPVLIIKGFSFTARYQYLIPQHQEQKFTKSVLIGAIVNLLANILLIPTYGAMGAVLGTIMAESTACFWQFFVIREVIKLKKIVKNCLCYLASGLIMFLGVRIYVYYFVKYISIFYILSEIVVGASIYIIFVFFVLKLRNNYLLDVIFNKVRKE